MNNLFSILKIDILNSLAVMQYKNTKKNKAKSKGPLISSIVSVLIVCIVFGFYGFMLSLLAHQSGNDSAIITIGVGMGGFSTLLMTFGRAYGTLFKSKDYELLASMPIKTNTIVASKIISLLFVNYLYFLMPFLPSLIMDYVFCGVTFLSVLTGLLTIILGPFVATVFCTGLSYIIGTLLAKSKYKNVLSTISTVLMFIVIFIGVFSLEMNGIDSEDEVYMATLIGNLQQVFSKGYFPSIFVANAMQGSYLDLLWFVLVSVIPFVLFVYLISKNYVYINSNGNTSYKNTNFKLDDTFKKEKNSSALKAMIKKEAKVFFGTNIYCMNCIVGPIMSTIMTGIYSFMFTSELTEMPSNISTIACTVLILISAFTFGMMPSTGVSVSIEGKNFWILKSSPIKTETIFLAKCLLYILLCLPFVLINTVVVSIFFTFKFYDYIFMILAPIAIIIGSTFISLWVNTCRYKLDWTNPVQVVKSGTGTLVTMLVSFAFDIILIIPSVVMLIIGFYAPILTLLIAIIYDVVAYLILFNNGKKRFENIQF